MLKGHHDYFQFEQQGGNIEQYAFLEKNHKLFTYNALHS